MSLFKPFLFPVWMNYFNEQSYWSNYYTTYQILFLFLCGIFDMCILSNYNIQYLSTLIIQTHLVRSEMIVSVIKNRKNNQTYFFNPNGMRKGKPSILLFLSIFTLVAFVWMTNPWHRLTHMVMLFGIFTRERERKGGWMCFSFLLCATGVPLILRCIF